jgi:hypothetical protein
MGRIDPFLCFRECEAMWNTIFSLVRYIRIREQGKDAKASAEGRCTSQSWTTQQASERWIPSAKEFGWEVSLFILYRIAGFVAQWLERGKILGRTRIGLLCMCYFSSGGKRAWRTIRRLSLKTKTACLKKYVLETLDSWAIKNQTN